VRSAPWDAKAALVDENPVTRGYLDAAVIRMGGRDNSVPSLITGSFLFLIGVGVVIAAAMGEPAAHIWAALFMTC